MTVIKRRNQAAGLALAPQRRPRLATDWGRGAARLVVIVVVLAMAASGAAASPATTLALGLAAIVWLMATFDAERPGSR